MPPDPPAIMAPANGRRGHATASGYSRRGGAHGLRIGANPDKARTTTAVGSPNYAQDTDVSPDGRTLYVSRGYLGDVAAFDVASGKQVWRRSLNTTRADHM